jgi:hypothetical protein
MKNSQLAFRVFIGLILLGGGVVMFITKPILLFFIGIVVLTVAIMISILEIQSDYRVFGRKYNIFYQIGKFLDSFPQIIKDKKMTAKEEAKELVDKMYLVPELNGSCILTRHTAKQCALITVDSILKVAFYNTDNLYEHYMQVKQEIEKL